MQHIITFNLDKPLELPLAYQHGIQSMIYNCLSSNPKLSNVVHNKGYALDNGQTFKLFCFSLLQGPAQVSNGQITFKNHVTLEIRTSSPEIDHVLTSTFTRLKPLEIFGHELSDYTYTLKNITIKSKNLTIKMVSPICVYTTTYNDEKRYTKYYSPQEIQFFDLISTNSSKKYFSLMNTMPETALQITAGSVCERDKFVTKFKNKIYITAWNGIYNLQADENLLTFLYNTGLGSRNSQGFGMFDIIV